MKDICVSVSGDQPLSASVESRILAGGREAITLFLEWDYDGFAGPIKDMRPDAEPITLILDGKGRAEEVHVRSHWRVGVFGFDECKGPSGKVLVSIPNMFHTTVIAGCSPRQIVPMGSGWWDRFRFISNYMHAKASGGLAMDSFVPLRRFGSLAPVPEGHIARSHPVFFDGLGGERVSRLEPHGPAAK